MTVIQQVPTATDAAQGAVELATVEEANAGTDTTRAVMAAGLLLIKPAAPGTAFVGGDLTGNARGANALDIQSGREVFTQVANGEKSSAFGYMNTASSYQSSAIGYWNTASGHYGKTSAFGYRNTASGYRSSAIGYQNTADSTLSSAIGYYNTASNYWSSAIGYQNTASGYKSSAIGHQNTASGYYDGRTSAFGYRNTAEGDYSSAFGCRVKTTVNNTCEIGYWSSTTTRAGAVRMHSTGMVAMTVQKRDAAFNDGEAAAGSEADNSLGRGMAALRIHTSDGTCYLDWNDGGTVRTITLGDFIP